MTIDPVDVWKDTLDKLGAADVKSAGSSDFANWYNDRLANIETDPSALDSSVGFVFVFDADLFASLLASPPPVSTPSEGISAFADAWETTILATVYPTGLNVSPGAFIPPSSPATIFSSVTSVQVDPPSIVAGKARLAGLTSAQVSETGRESEFATAMKEATELLTITVEGMNSASPPTPLVAANVPLI